MPSRRRLLTSALATPLAASAAGTKKLTGDSVYARLGVKPVINGYGTVTMLGGSLMPPEVIEAMNEAARHFIPLSELQEKAGKYIAGLIGVPAAMITCGAASAITVATVACMARGDGKKLRQLPDTAGIPFEVIQQKTHRSGYEHQMTLAGAKIVTVETEQELINAVSPRTAMLFFLNKADPEGKINRAAWIAAGKRHNVPTFNDAAADVPPKGRLSQYVKEGFDLVAFSGGKGLLGPQNAGMLIGREDLVEAGRPAISPHGGIGRGMKVGKEEIAGLVAAVERYLRVDHDAEIRELDRRVSEMQKILGKVKGVRASRYVPVIANEVPHLKVEWDEASGAPTARAVVDRLEKGEPSIRVPSRGPRELVISVWMMNGTEHRTVAERLRQELS
jgi:L-seryl-tRNA(Ser) seleniumtransferase